VAAPTHRPDVPCETQEVPNLNAPGGPVAQFMAKGQKMPKPWKPGPLRKIVPLLKKGERLQKQKAKKKAAKLKAAQAKKKAAKGNGK
jgi:hypothetical protein